MTLAVKLDRDESHLNVSLTVSDKFTTRTVHNHIFEERVESKRNWTEALLLISLTRLTKPSHRNPHSLVRKPGVYNVHRRTGRGEEGDYTVSLHCYHQNDSCNKMGSDGSPFNVSLITRQWPQITIFEDKGEPKQNQTEVLLLTTTHCLFTSLRNASLLG